MEPLTVYTIADIRALQPCYDPTRYLAEDWSGTAVDVLRVSDCPAEDRIWVVAHWLDERTLRLFAVWCARRALALVEHPDPRSLTVCDVAERFANGRATREELVAAWDAAWAAARAAAWAAARAAASAASAARAAGAARDAGDAARDAGDAAWDAAWDAQIAHLLEMLGEPVLMARES